MLSRPLLIGVVPLVLVAACACGPIIAEEDLEAQSSAVITHPVVRFDGGVLDPDPGDPPLADGRVYIKALGHRCLDIGGRDAWVPGRPVVLEDCTYGVSQRVRVRELDASHDIELRAGALCIGVRGQYVQRGQVLELQACNGKGQQRFAFDGDALLMGGQYDGIHVNRREVIERANGATLAGTPLVVGARHISDAEYLRFHAADGSQTRPHTGFVRVANETALEAALLRGWGTVVEVEPRAALVLTHGPLRVPPGTTLRGYRMQLDPGPTILFQPKVGSTKDDYYYAFDLENDARVTGLRLLGPSRGLTEKDEPRSTHGVRTIGYAGMFVDHTEMSEFSIAAVSADGHASSWPEECPSSYPSWPRLPAVQVSDNFFHHNVRWGGGYGVVVNHGAFVDIRENTAYANRHTIAAQGHVENGYVAEDNFVLSEYPDYSSLDYGPQNDFDIHGNKYDDGHWRGGYSGDYLEIGWNTFLGKDQLSFQSRGTPCRFHALHDNTFRRPKGSSLDDKDGAIRHLTEDPAKVAIYANEYEARDPTEDLGVGDFDGDGFADVFVGTGRAWYFSSGGKTEWRYLNRASEHARELRFGDFDGDGRTDVLGVSTFDGKRAIDISWGGVSTWEHITTIDVALSDIAVGDFDGDGHADIFFADGAQWTFASGKNWFRAPFDRTLTFLAFSNRRTENLRFGDFDGPNGVPDGKTDIFGVTANDRWQVVTSGVSTQWQDLAGAPGSDGVAGLFTGDFDGDGWADIGRLKSSAFPPIMQWEYSPKGRSAFVALRTAAAGEAFAAMGRFAGTAKTDVLLWDGRDVSIAFGGANPVTAWSGAHLK